MGFNAAGDSSCGLNGASDVGVPGLVLGALAHNGGGTPSHLPPGGSDVIDEAPTGDAIFDQRHVLRPKRRIGDRCRRALPGRQARDVRAGRAGTRREGAAGHALRVERRELRNFDTLTVREGSSTGPLARVIKKIGPSSWG